MLNALTIAQYFMSRDPEHMVFQDRIVDYPIGRFYEATTRLNAFLHLAQNLWIAWSGEKLFREDFYAYDSGAIVPVVQRNFTELYYREDRPELPEPPQKFLTELFDMLKGIPLDELILLSREDTEWAEKNNRYGCKERRMDSLSRKDEYRQQYADVLMTMNFCKGEQGRLLLSDNGFRNTDRMTR